MGQKGSRFVWSGREADRKDLFAGEKSPFTNPCKLTLFCSPKVNISLFLMESLHYGKILGEDRTNIGSCWEIATGIYCDILGRVCGRLAAGRGLLQGFGWEHTYLAGGIVCSRLSASRSHRKVTVCTPRRRGVPFTRVKGTKTRLGLCPKTPFSLSCGWIRTMRSIVRTAPQIRSQGACGAFYFGFCRDRIKTNTL